MDIYSEINLKGNEVKNAMFEVLDSKILSSTPPTIPNSGFLKIYFKNGTLKKLDESGVEKDVVENFANNGLIFDANRSHSTAGFNYELTTDGGLFAQGWQTMSIVDSTIGFANNFTKADAVGVKFFAGAAINERMRVLASNGFIGVNQIAPIALFDIKSHGTLPTDIVLNIRNNSDTDNLLSICGDGTALFKGSSGTAFTPIFAVNRGGSVVLAIDEYGTKIAGNLYTNNIVGSGISNIVLSNQSGGGKIITINPSLGTLAIGYSAASTSASLDIKAHGALVSDMALRIRNSANSANFVEVNGDGTFRIGDGNGGLNNSISYVPDGRMFLSKSGGNFIEMNGGTTPNRLFGGVNGWEIGGTAKTTLYTTGITAYLFDGTLQIASGLNVSGGATNTIHIENGVAPFGANPANQFKLYSADQGGVAGRASFHVKSEDGTINSLGYFNGFGYASGVALGARVDIKAQGALSTDLAFRVRNSANTGNIAVLNGDFSGSYAKLGIGLSSGTPILHNIDALYTSGTAPNISLGTGALAIREGANHFVRFIGGGVRSIVVSNGAANTGLGDAFEMYSADQVAGNAAPHFRTENGDVIKLYTGASLTAGLTALVQNPALIFTPTYTLTPLASGGFGFATKNEAETFVMTTINLQTRVRELELRLIDNGLIS